MRLRLSDPFWKLSPWFFARWRPLVVSLLGALVSSMCYGAGLTMLLPVYHLLVQQKQTLPQLVDEYLVRSEYGALAWLGGILQPLVPADRFYGFLVVVATGVALTAFAGIGRYVQSVFVQYSVRDTVHVWRKRILWRLLHAPLPVLWRHHIGDHVARVLYDTGSLAAAYHGVFSTAVVKSLTGIVAVAGAFFINWRLTIGAVAAAPVVGLMMAVTARYTRRAAGKALAGRSRALTILRETFQHIRAVKLNQAEPLQLRRFLDNSRRLEESELFVRKLDAASKPLVELVTMIGVAAAASVAAYNVLRLDVDAAEYFTVLTMLAAGGATFQRALGLTNLIHESSPSAQRILEALSWPVEPVRRAGDRRLPRHRRDIVFEHVSFRYDGQEKPAVHDVTVRIPFGACVAIVGRSGSGKSTLINLLCRLFEPESGRILLDGHDIAAAGLRSLRRQLAVVPQETVMLGGTLAENIAFGVPGASRSAIEAAAVAAGADEFIRPLPRGYDTVLGDEGLGLSGGQRQRVCVARALLRDPSVLILDEATSQVDAESEAKITSVVASLRRRCTTIIIAHRLSTFAAADMLVVMDGGRVIDSGRHDELLVRCPAYRSLVQAQVHIGAA